MTTAEILRTQSPETDLERALFGRIAEAIEEAESARDEVRECGSAYDDLDSERDAREEAEANYERLLGQIKTIDLGSATLAPDLQKIIEGT